MSDRERKLDRLITTITLIIVMVHALADLLRHFTGGHSIE